MVTKIELAPVREMGFEAMKDELIMRLHDAQLRYREDRAIEFANKFEYFESLVKVDRFASAWNIAENWIDKSFLTSHPENGQRMIDLFFGLMRSEEIDADYAEEESSALVAPEQFELIEVECVDEFGRTEADIDRLNQLEFAIQKGIDGFKAAGEALREIRYSGLYRTHLIS